MSANAKGRGPKGPSPVTVERIVRHVVERALRRTASPFEMRLALEGWQEIHAEWRAAEVEAMAAFHSEEQTG